MTLGALLGEGGKGFLPEKVDVIEIEKAFLDAMGPESVRRYLEPFVPQAVLDGVREERGAQSHESKGVRFHFGDARRLLACELSDRRWDAIVSQPSEPWIPGAAPLFTVEFFEAARRHLEPGGIFFQWLQMYKIEDDGIRLLIRTFHRVFPEVFCLRPPGTGELVLVGCSSTPPLELFLGPPVGPSSAAAGLELPVDRLAIFLGGSRGIASWAGYSPNLPINTDSRSELHFLSTWSLYGGVDLARRNLALLQKTAGEDPVVNYLPAPWRSDSSFRRTLASRNIRLGDFAEALAILDGDDSKEAQEIRSQIPKY